MCRRGAIRRTGSSRWWWSCRRGARPPATGGTPVVPVCNGQDVRCPSEPPRWRLSILPLPVKLSFEDHEEGGGVVVLAREGERAVLPLHGHGFQVARVVEHVRGDHARAVHALDGRRERSFAAVVADEHEAALLVGGESGESGHGGDGGGGGHLVRIFRDDVAEDLERPVRLVEPAQAVLVAPVPAAARAVVVGLVEAGVLEAGEHGEVERGGVDAVVRGGAGVGLADLVLRGGAVDAVPRDEVVPFVDDGLALRETGLVEELAHARRLGDEVLGVLSVVVPAHEVGRHARLAAGREELLHVLGRAAGEGGAADVEVRELRLEPLEAGHVEVDELGLRAAPAGPDVGLVVDLPVRDVPFEAVAPALRVVAHDAGERLGVARVVGRIARVEEPLARVLDGGAHAVEDLHADVLRELKHVVGRLEHVVARVGRVEVLEGEEVLRVDDALSVVDERPVVRARGGEVEGGEVLVVVLQAARVRAWAVAGAVQPLVDASRGDGEVDGGGGVRATGHCAREGERADDGCCFHAV